MGVKVDNFLRATGGSTVRLGGGAGTAISNKLCSGASSVFPGLWAVARGDETGLSDARYVVAKMLSRSDSCGRSTDDFQR